MPVPFAGAAEGGEVAWGLGCVLSLETIFIEAHRSVLLYIWDESKTKQVIRILGRALKILRFGNDGQPGPIRPTQSYAIAH